MAAMRVGDATHVCAPSAWFMAAIKPEKHKDKFILDLVNRPELLGEPIPDEPPILVKGFNGNIEPTEGCGNKPFGKAHLLPSAPMNIVSLSQAEDSFDITYRKAVFELKKEGRTMTFRQNDFGVYALQDESSAMTSTESHFTNEQKARALEVMKLHNALNHPSDDSLSTISRTDRSLVDTSRQRISRSHVPFTDPAPLASSLKHRTLQLAHLHHLPLPAPEI
jgi:hypothetical protein